MKKRWWISVICLFPGMYAGAQTVKLKPVAPLAVMTPLVTRTVTGFSLKPVSLFGATPQKFPTATPVSAPVYRMAPDAYYRDHFGFFCKQEWNWQKQTGLPVKFRLGSYSYAQQQEGKH